ncbi:MAG: 2-oxoglutarate dehydrogenase E1 component, partial [Myxococcales bacterium]
SVPPASAPTGNGNGHAVAGQGQGQGGVELHVATGSVAAYSQSQVANLVNQFRARGHLYADVNPLSDPPAVREELTLGRFGLNEADLDRPFSTGDLLGQPATLALRDIIGLLEETYCRSIGVEFVEIEDHEQRQWLQQRMETSRNRLTLTKAEQLRVLKMLTDAEALEQFIHRSFVGAKRFSLEGAESLIPMLDLLIEAAAEHGVEELVLGMAHRGRLNVLCNIMGKNVRELFAAFDDKHPERYMGSGDVKYHHGYSSDRQTASGRSIHLTMAVNPSHLEFVNPVVEGRTRAKQDRRGDTQRQRVIPLLIHGDAAFIGQGVVPETLNLAGLDGYSTGGTVHVVVNNQVGFTTDPTDARSTRYATDIARMLKVPVFHVNGEDPEAVVWVTRLAVAFRQRFAKDVVIDMYCYRKFGHNEGDEPRFTQPRMYSIIDRQPSVREVYLRHLLAMGQITGEQAEQILRDSQTELANARAETQQKDFANLPDTMNGLWKPYRAGLESGVPDVPTAVAREQLVKLATQITTIPADFEANPKVADIVNNRKKAVDAGKGLDWGTCEALAFASLLADGTSIRLSGQDSRRGTFAHRHAVLRDRSTGASYTPLQSVQARGARFEVYDSALSEQGVMGFDYGYSLDSPDVLVMWEAQFGDFANGAQVIIDQFLAAGEDKWRRLSGLTLLLPHGYEGQGPEHSSARLERFLQLAAEDNIQVCNPTNGAQMFHLLRRQVLRPWRKPLVVMTPKSLLRAPAAASTLDDLAQGSFKRVLLDEQADPARVKRVLLCSGKVYYDLRARQQETKTDDVAILRLEQLYPLHEEVVAALAPFADGTPLVWVQDEPENMGAWRFILAALPRLISSRLPLSCVSRAESASPATGSLAAHKMEQTMLIDAAFQR